MKSVSLLFKVSKWSKLKNEMSHIELSQLILEDSKYIEHLAAR